MIARYIGTNGRQLGHGREMAGFTEGDAVHDRDYSQMKESATAVTILFHNIRKIIDAKAKDKEHKKHTDSGKGETVEDFWL